MACIDVPLFHCHHPCLVLVVVGFEVPLDFKQRTKQGEANKRKSTVDCRERERERERRVGEGESESERKSV